MSPLRRKGPLTSLVSVLAASLPPGSRSPQPPLFAEAPAPSDLLSAPLPCRSLELSLELSRVSLERDSLSRELLRTIHQKVALTQELEAWQVRGGAGGADRAGRGRQGRGRTLTRPAGPAALPAGRHAGGHRTAAAITTPERAECGWIRPEPRPAALLAAPGPWARRRLLQQPLPKDLSARSRGPPLPSLAHFPLLANGATGPDCLPKAAGALSTRRGWARAHREQGPALGARDPRWVAGAGVAELFYKSI